MYVRLKTIRETVTPQNAAITELSNLVRGVLSPHFRPSTSGKQRLKCCRRKRFWGKYATCWTTVLSVRVVLAEQRNFCTNVINSYRIWLRNKSDKPAACLYFGDRTSDWYNGNVATLGTAAKNHARPQNILFFLYTARKTADRATATLNANNNICF